MATPKKTRRFTPPPAPPSDVLPSQDVAAESQVLGWTVNGQPIPEHVAHLITYEMTDQGIAESRATRTTPEPMVQVLSDAWDKTVARKGDAEPWDSFDPLTEAVDKVREPGFSYRALSPRMCEKRGTRGWEPVLDKDNRQVKVGNLFLARMPLERAERRDAHYRGLSDEALRDAAAQYAIDQEKIVRDANVSGLAPLRVGDTVINREDPNHAASIGVETHRGEGAAA